MLFYATPGVGADKMMVKDGRLCTTISPVRTLNNMVPESDNKNIGKAATGNDFLTLWPKDQASADAELQKAKDSLMAAVLGALGISSPTTSPSPAILSTPPIATVPKPQTKVAT
jgi:hypothetical protein